MKLETDRLILLTLSECDPLVVLEFETTNRTFLAPYEPIREQRYFTGEYWTEQIDSYRQLERAGAARRFYLFAKNNPECAIGRIGFSNIVRGVFHACHLGFALAESACGQAYMSEALRASIAFMFEQENLHRIQANYMPTNDRSGNLLKRLGFIEEGRAKDYLYIAGRWQDHILTSLTNPRWREVK
ncbi:ribosomal protein S5-alanine N-acetyltransferase [bacterium]|nr:ribosomal protein S5-alanine N-acetyltransferase [bacterium]